MINKVSVIGLGKLGACMAAAIASRGFTVIGLDVVRGVVDSFNEGKAPVREPDLQEMITANRERLSATSDYETAVMGSDVSFVIVPTPSELSGAFSTKYAAEAMASIGKALRKKDGYHVVCLTSTVLPGVSDSEMIPIIERESGKRCGVDFGYCYSPEFIALGSVIRDFLNPDFILTGEADPQAGADLADFYERMLSNATPIARMTCTNAELAKIAVNTYVTMKISFANTIAEICQRLPGGDVDVVTKALGHDARIGPKYLTGALGFGGPCFPRDNRAIAYLARSLGVEPLLAESTDVLNQHRAQQIVALVAGAAGPTDTIAVLGLSYKPSTEVVEESQGLLIARALVDAGHKVIVHDPLALDERPLVAVKRELGDRVEYVSNLDDAVHRAQAVVIANPDPAYKALNAQHFAGRERPVFVLDCWRYMRDTLAHTPNVHYRAVGVATE
jgi:UDPglucose 6-dehydrogenase